MMLSSISQNTDCVMMNDLRSMSLSHHQRQFVRIRYVINLVTRISLLNQEESLESGILELSGKDIESENTFYSQYEKIIKLKYTYKMNGSFPSNIGASGSRS